MGRNKYSAGEIKEIGKLLRLKNAGNRLQQKMYTTLFNAVTDALKKMEVQNYGDAKELLISAQQKTEEIYITAQN